jgi:hypothetical protein
MWDAWLPIQRLYYDVIVISSVGVHSTSKREAELWKPLWGRCMMGTLNHFE